MDPIAAVKAIREYVLAIRRYADGGEFRHALDALEEATEYAEALRDWLAKGGFRPAGAGEALADLGDMTVYLEEAMEDAFFRTVWE